MSPERREVAAAPRPWDRGDPCVGPQQPCPAEDARGWAGGSWDVLQGLLSWAEVEPRGQPVARPVQSIRVGTVPLPPSVALFSAGISTTSSARPCALAQLVVLVCSSGACPHAPLFTVLCHCLARSLCHLHLLLLCCQLQLPRTSTPALGRCAGQSPGDRSVLGAQSPRGGAGAGRGGGRRGAASDVTAVHGG